MRNLTCSFYFGTMHNSIQFNSHSRHEKSQAAINNSDGLNFAESCVPHLTVTSACNEAPWASQAVTCKLRGPRLHFLDFFKKCWISSRLRTFLEISRLRWFLRWSDESSDNDLNNFFDLYSRKKFMESRHINWVKRDINFACNFLVKLVALHRNWHRIWNWFNCKLIAYCSTILVELLSWSPWITFLMQDFLIT
jgi:hypothetical protein